MSWVNLRVYNLKKLRISNFGMRDYSCFEGKIPSISNEKLFILGYPMNPNASTSRKVSHMRSSSLVSLIKFPFKSSQLKCSGSSLAYWMQSGIAHLHLSQSLSSSELQIDTVISFVSASKKQLFSTLQILKNFSKLLFCLHWINSWHLLCGR